MRQARRPVRRVLQSTAGSKDSCILRRNSAAHPPRPDDLLGGSRTVEGGRLLHNLNVGWPLVPMTLVMREASCQVSGSDPLCAQ